jgi:hypothetical protein
MLMQDLTLSFGPTGEQLQAIMTAAMGTVPSQLDFVPLVQALLGHARQQVVFHLGISALAHVTDLCRATSWAMN